VSVRRALGTATVAVSLVALLCAAEIDARSPATDEMAVVAMLGIKSWCDARAPEFATRSQRAFARWSTTNREVISAVQGDTNYSILLTRVMGQLTERQRLLSLKLKGRDRLGLAVTCSDEAIEAFDPAPIPEPAFASPRATWTRFADAVKTSDHDGAIRCLTATAVTTYLEALIDPGEAELRATILRAQGATFRQIDRGTADMTSTGSGGVRQTIRFRLLLGNWKVASL
jgi:hypothetical protein